MTWGDRGQQGCLGMVILAGGETGIAILPYARPQRPGKYLRSSDISGRIRKIDA